MAPFRTNSSNFHLTAFDRGGPSHLNSSVRRQPLNTSRQRILDYHRDRHVQVGTFSVMERLDTADIFKMLNRNNVFVGSFNHRSNRCALLHRGLNY